MSLDYDLFVIGGGSAGVRAARLASQEGANVGLAEESRMGGTCVIRGCVPKKFMVYASEFPRDAGFAKEYGWSSADLGAFDWPRFRARMHGELDKLEGIYRTNLRKAGVEIHDTRAALRDPHTVELADGGTATAKHVLVAVGGQPKVPPIANGELGIVSDDVFHLERVPERMLIVGGGYIGSEFACVFNGYGAEVHMFVRGAQILRGFDEEARGHVADCMGRRGVRIHTGCAPIEIERRGNGRLWVKGSSGFEGEFDCLLWATGRKPSTKGLGLEEAGVELDRHGSVVVDEYSQTSVPSVYAVGDCTGRLELTPVAIREAVAFVETVFRGNPTKIDHDLVPSATFTQPEMGTVGLTEEQAGEREPCLVYATAFRPLRQAFVGEGERALFKMLVSRRTRKVLGVHIVGPGAAEMTQMVAIALKMGATKEDFDRTCALHPTLAEEIVTLREPVRAID